MKSLIILAFITLAIQSAIPGGYVQVKYNPNNEYDSKAFSQIQIANSLRIHKVVKCFRQVVSGYNYIFQLQVEDGFGKLSTVQTSPIYVPLNTINPVGNNFEEIKCDKDNYYLNEALNTGLDQLEQANKNFQFQALVKCFKQMVNGFNFVFIMRAKDTKSNALKLFQTQAIYVPFVQTDGSLIGGFQEYKFDINNPIDAKAMQLGISNLQLVNSNDKVEVVKCFKKIVNGVYYIFQFQVTDTDGNVSVLESEPVFISSSEKFEEKNQIEGGFEERKFDSNDEFDARALNLALQKINSENQVASGFYFTKVLSCQRQLVNGWNYKFELTYQTAEALSKNVVVEVYVPFEADENNEQAYGGFEQVEFNVNNEFDMKAMKELYEEAGKRNVTVSNIVKVYRQVVNGFNYKFVVIVADKDGVKTQEEIKVYVPLNNQQ